MTEVSSVNRPVGYLGRRVRRDKDGTSGPRDRTRLNDERLFCLRDPQP